MQALRRWRVLNWALAPMLVWALHFVALYLSASLVCEWGVPGQEAAALRAIGIGLSLLALLGLALCLRGLLQPQARAPEAQHGREDTELRREVAADATRFVRAFGVLLWGLSLLAVALNAFMLLMPQPCYA